MNITPPSGADWEAQERLREALRVQAEETVAAAKSSPAGLKELQFNAVVAERDRLRAAVNAVRALANQATVGFINLTGSDIRAALDAHLGEG